MSRSFPPIILRPRIDELDLQEWAARHRKLGDLREALAEAVRARIAAERDEPLREQADVISRTLDEHGNRLAAVIARELVLRLPGLIVPEGAGGDVAPAESRQTFQSAFTDARFTDDDE